MTAQAATTDTLTDARTRSVALARRLAVRLAPSAVPGLVMLLLARYHLGKPTLGWDELATLSACRRTVGQMWELAKHMDGVIAPYYLFMHFWTDVFGTSEIAMRLPSALAVAGAVALAGELGRRLFGGVTGFTAAMMLTLVPSLTYYAQEARGYGLALFFATLATLLCYRAAERRTWPAWAFYALAMAGAVFAHMFTIVILLGHAVIVWLRVPGRERLRWAAVLALPLLAAAPLVYLGIHQQGTQLSWMPKPEWRDLSTAPATIFGSNINGIGSAASSRIVAIAFVFIGLALAVRAKRGVVAELATLAVAPPLILIAVSILRSPMWMPRYALSAVVPLTLLAAASLIGPDRPLRRTVWVRAALVLAILLPMQFTVNPAVRLTDIHVGGDYRAMARELELQHASAQDGILYGANTVWGLRGAVDYYVPQAYRPTDVLIKKTGVQRGQLSANENWPPENYIGTQQQMWFVCILVTTPTATDPLHLQKVDNRIIALLKQYKVAKIWRSKNLFLLRFEKLPG